jgi:hypothetical protein
MTCVNWVTPTGELQPNFSVKKIQDPAVPHLLSFLKKLQIEELFSNMVSDPRSKNIAYGISTILQKAFVTVLFRTGSKNAFHQEGTSTHQAESSTAYFIGSDKEKIPSIKTVDDVLANLKPTELNEVLMSVFEIVRKNKFFRNYSHLLPGKRYHLAIDAEVVHFYTPDSAHDCEHCPYCLKRTRREITWFVHMHVVVCLVCPGNLRIPLYLYPIHAKSLHYEENDSDEKFKQECELSAFPIILEKIKTRFPKLKFCVLLDSLYANGPALKLLQKHHMDYMVVRKKGSMKTVGDDCNGLELLPDGETKGLLEAIKKTEKETTHRKYTFFNDVEYQDLKLNILRFDEEILNEKGVKKSGVHWEWIVSWKLRKNNVVVSANRGRMRWLEEDLFNTLKNRGYDIRHDYSRNSNVQVIWAILILLAFLVTELFVLIRSVLPIKKNRSIKDFMRSIFSELKYLSYQLIFESRILFRKTQIRFCFEKNCYREAA